MTQFIPARILDQLSKASEDINQASDELSAIIREIDEHLKKMGLGVPAECPESVQLTNDGPDYRLAYAKADNNTHWSLCVSIYDNHFSGMLQPLIDARRDVRIALAPKIPELLQLLINEANQKTQAVRNVLSILRGTPTTLKKLPSPFEEEDLPPPPRNEDIPY